MASENGNGRYITWKNFAMLVVGSALIVLFWSFTDTKADIKKTQASISSLDAEKLDRSEYREDIKEFRQELSDLRNNLAQHRFNTEGIGP